MVPRDEAVSLGGVPGQPPVAEKRKGSGNTLDDLFDDAVNRAVASAST